jgi:hypothetical protein
MTFDASSSGIDSPTFKVANLDAGDFVLHAHMITTDRHYNPDSVMTELISDQDCSRCGGVLVPLQVSRAKQIPPGTDYVCLKCDLPYRWFGNPPRLVAISVVDTADDNDDD